MKKTTLVAAVLTAAFLMTSCDEPCDCEGDEAPILGAPSNIIPLAYSISGKIPNVESAVGITVISISAYGVFMIAPAFMGYIAKYFGINYVFTPMIFHPVPICKQAQDLGETDLRVPCWRHMRTVTFGMIYRWGILMWIWKERP